MSSVCWTRLTAFAGGPDVGDKEKAGTRATAEFLAEAIKP